MISSHAALSQLRAMNDQVVDPSSGPRHESHAIGRLLGSLGRLSCTGNDPLDSSCHLMGCMRSYTTLITRDAPDVTDRPFHSFPGAVRRSILRSHHCLHHLGQPPATHGRARHDQCFNSGTLAWRSSSHCCRLRRRVSPLQITDRVLSSLMQRERVVATRLVAGISSSPLPLHPAVPPHVEPYRHIRAHHLVHLQARAPLCQRHHRPRALAEECAAVLQMRP